MDMGLGQQCVREDFFSSQDWPHLMRGEKSWNRGCMPEGLGLSIERENQGQEPDIL